MTTIADFVYHHIQNPLSAETGQMWRQAREEYLKGHPDKMILLLRGELRSFEKAAQEPHDTSHEICSGSAHSRAHKAKTAENLCLILEQLAVIYGKDRVWANELAEQRAKQFIRVWEYMNDQVRSHEDSSDESLDPIAQAWHDAGESFKHGRIQHLATLAAFEGDSEIVNILLVWNP